jgi:hypothetical protein
MIERWQHTRIYFSLPMEFQAQLTNSDESWKSPAVLKNFSRGGLYFECETLPQVKPGSVADFTFNTIPPSTVLSKALSGLRRWLSASNPGWRDRIISGWRCNSSPVRSSVKFGENHPSSVTA